MWTPQTKFMVVLFAMDCCLEIKQKFYWDMFNLNPWQLLPLRICLWWPSRFENSGKLTCFMFIVIWMVSGPYVDINMNPVVTR